MGTGTLWDAIKALACRARRYYRAAQEVDAACTYLAEAMYHAGIPEPRRYTTILEASAEGIAMRADLIVYGYARAARRNAKHIDRQKKAIRRNNRGAK